MKTWGEVHNKIDSLMDMMNNATADGANWLADNIALQIDALLWVIGDESGLPPLDEDDTYACYRQKTMIYIDLIRNCVMNINKQPDKNLREEAKKELIGVIKNNIVGDQESERYKDGTIFNTYINYDSNCGLTVIDANIDLETMADYILENEDINTITVSDAVNIMNEEFGERNEFWDDLIDEEGFAMNEEYIMNALEDVIGETASDEDDEKLRQDLKAYKKQREEMKS